MERFQAWKLVGFLRALPIWLELLHRPNRLWNRKKRKRAGGAAVNFWFRVKWTAQWKISDTNFGYQIKSTTNRCCINYPARRIRKRSFDQNLVLDQANQKSINYKRTDTFVSVGKGRGETGQYGQCLKPTPRIYHDHHTRSALIAWQTPHHLLRLKFEFHSQRAHPVGWRCVQCTCDVYRLIWTSYAIHTAQPLGSISIAFHIILYIHMAGLLPPATLPHTHLYRESESSIFKHSHTQMHYPCRKYGQCITICLLLPLELFFVFIHSGDRKRATAIIISSSMLGLPICTVLHIPIIINTHVPCAVCCLL